MPSARSPSVSASRAVEHDAHEIFSSALVTMTEAVNRAGIDAVDIAKQRETTALGATYPAGLAASVWDDAAALVGQWQEEQRFTPQMAPERREALYGGWQRAVQATLGFRPA
ncbi:hypothetical protein N8I74_01770 [Chitiniphilus purpureus]|uniref:Carbohydrate kinase FGGY C-terminal domain-containing protein n=1 Tax=Chitiniphilus purpureus TaxID=2981137 RepID=A0ABY6DN30_9NEIS|nr:hypothetical protein [Chitiniphilus sp. CD1]UXY15769.1 hypothetical protein N8I74_01770 [Chitiniphilus sp. CD1]